MSFASAFASYFPPFRSTNVKCYCVFSGENSRHCHIYRNTTEFCRYVRNTFCSDKNRKAQVTESPHIARSSANQKTLIAVVVVKRGSISRWSFVLAIRKVSTIPTAEYPLHTVGLLSVAAFRYIKTWFVKNRFFATIGNGGTWLRIVSSVQGVDHVTRASLLTTRTVISRELTRAIA